MRAIDRTLVDEVWRGMSTYAPARVASEAQRFLELQPHFVNPGEPEVFSGTLLDFLDSLGRP